MSKKRMKTKDGKQSGEIGAVRRAFLKRSPQFLDKFFNGPESRRILKYFLPYLKKGHVVADLGCGWGYYSFILADIVGPEGMVYSVDLSKHCIDSIKRKADKKGYLNIKAYATTAADLGFIKSRSIDFIFANGLLCVMEYDRDSAVKEMKRILKPQGHAYISLGALPPWGLVNEEEWNGILNEFSVKKRSNDKELWALLATK